MKMENKVYFFFGTKFQFFNLFGKSSLLGEKQ